MRKIAKVVIDNATVSFDREFDYYIPLKYQEIIKVGSRVTVPFGGYNKRRMALVMDIVESQDINPKIKEISSVVDSSPLLGQEMLEMVRFMHDYTFCRYYDGVKAILPSGVGVVLNSIYTLAEGWELQQFSPAEEEIVNNIRANNNKLPLDKLTQLINQKDLVKNINNLLERKILLQIYSDKQKIQDEKSVMVSLNKEVAHKFTVKQQLVQELLLQGDISLKELLYQLPITKNVVQNLAGKGVVNLYEMVGYRNPHEGVMARGDKITLTADQTKAYDKLSQLLTGEKPHTALLYGVTGSGKTSVFLRLVEDTVAKGKTAIIMVPEISLTPQTVEKFHGLFGDRVAVLHSSLTMSQRMDEWKRINDGGADVVVGTRSAVFAPLKNIGLIVIDEEQEHTYKSEKSPRFHARDLAIFRSRHHNALVLLASATPSIESYYNSKTGRYTLVELGERYTGSKLPEVYIVDLLQDVAVSDSVGISGHIVEELYINLQAKEQSILLLNRRGHNTSIRCSSCATTIKCPNCDLPLTYHSKNNKAMCHYCGHSDSSLKSCGDCGSEMIRYMGVGTQMVEQELAKLFPEARVLRMDMDTTMSRDAYDKNFKAFARGDYDIMLGTQMVAKGLNFPNVTLVGVLNPDQLLNSQNFRGYEKAFSLITQVVGRSGRGDKAGRAYIQTANSDHTVIRCGAKQDYEAFYKEEIVFRKLNLYPPFCKISSVGLVSEDELLLEAAAKKAAEIITNLASQYKDLPVRVLSPVQASLYKAGGKFRYQIQIKHKHHSDAYKLLWQALEEFSRINLYKKVNMIIDTNYDS